MVCGSIDDFGGAEKGKENLFAISSLRFIFNISESKIFLKLFLLWLSKIH